MPTQEQIYLTEAEQYEALVTREDYRGNIRKALDEIVNVDRLDVLTHDESIAEGAQGILCFLGGGREGHDKSYLGKIVVVVL